MALNQIDWKLLTTIGLAIVGWFFAHWLNVSRDLAQRRREARLRSLEAAYLRLANSSGRTFTEERMDEIELFVSELQLYGTPRQVELMGRIVEGLKIPNNTVNFTPLLLDLRDTIRLELKLESLKEEIWWFRFNRINSKAMPKIPTRSKRKGT
jgi:hypothetical protein